MGGEFCFAGIAKGRQKVKADQKAMKALAPGLDYRRTPRRTCAFALLVLRSPTGPSYAYATYLSRGQPALHRLSVVAAAHGRASRRK